jgi:hypothetical protein
MFAMQSLLVRVTLVLAIAATSQCAALWAAENAKSPAIAIGRPINETLTILRDHKIDWHSGNPRQVTRGYNGGIDDSVRVAFDLDKGTYAHVYYSKLTRVITRIELTVYPIGGASKISESQFAAKSLRLENDGSYVVHLLPREEPKSISELKNEYPKSKP